MRGSQQATGGADGEKSGRANKQNRGEKPIRPTDTSKYDRQTLVDHTIIAEGKINQYDGLEGYRALEALADAIQEADTWLRAQP